MDHKQGLAAGGLDCNVDASTNTTMKQIIHVNQHKIRANAKNGTSDPVLTVKTYKDNAYAHEVSLRDADGKEVARVVYSPDKPLSCGARVWIEFDTDDLTAELS
jgi:hypothetical protein